jgi:hypothetical protein
MKLTNETMEAEVIAAMQETLEAVGRLVHAAACEMQKGYALLWNRPAAEVAAILNALGLAKVQALFEANTLHGTNINGILEFVDDPTLDARVAVVPGKMVAIDLATGAITVTEFAPPAPAEPEA